MRKTFEIATNLVVIVVGIAVLYTLGVNYRTNSALPRSLHPGTQLSIASLSLPHTRPTLLMFVRKGCHFCEDSLPFYRRLDVALKSYPNVTGIMAVLPDSKAEATEFMASANLNIPYTSGVDISSLGVSGTPTLVLLEPNGKIKNAWVGRLQPDKEQEVLKAVTRQDKRG